MASKNTQRSWRFVYLLATLLFLIAVHPFFVGNVWAPLLLDLFLSLVIVASVFAVSQSATTRVVVFVLAIPVLSSRWLVHLFPYEAVEVFSLVTGAAFIAFVAGKILFYVIRRTRITSDTIAAALSVYLLLGLSWAFVYALVEQLSPGAFAFPAADVGSGLLRQLFYFSLVTLTTVGYGDVTPVDPLAQGFSNLEAVLGQIYLAVLISRLVGVHVAQGVRRDNLD